MLTADDDAELPGLSPNRILLSSLKVRLLKWAPYPILTGLVLFGVLFPQI